jgi:membrane-associated phospholipid phosphatase
VASNGEHAVKQAGRDAPGQLPLLPGGLRRLAVVVVAGCAALTTLIGVLVNHRHHAGVLDKALDRFIRGHIGKYPGLLNPLARIGSPVVVTVLAAVLVVACLATRRWYGAVLVAVGTVAASVVSEYLLKPLVAHHLGDGESFPSGHATGMFALETALVLLLLSPPHLKVPQRLRAALAVAGLVVAVAVPVAMVGLYHHYFSDIVGGAAVGTAVLLLTALALDGLGRRRRRIPPQTPPHTGTTAHGSGSEHATVGA